MGLIQELQQADAQRRSETDAMRQGVASFRQDCARGDAQRRSNVTSYLQSETGAMRQRVASFRQDCAQGDAQRRSNVTSYLQSETGAMRQRVASLLQDLAQGSAQRRADSKSRANRVGVTPPPRPGLGEEAIARPGEVTGESLALRNRVFEHLANHPDGTRMTELEQEFGLPRVQMARLLRSLTEDNRVEKRDLHYFAV